MSAGGVPADITKDLLWGWLQGRCEWKNEHPWREEDVDGICTRIYAKEEARDRSTVEVVDLDSTGTDELKFQTLAQIRSETGSKEVTWLCRGWVPERGPCLVAGPSHVGKTWLMIDLAIAVATGGVFLDKYEVKAGPVLFLAGEDDKRLLLQRLGRHPNPAIDRHFKTGHTK